MPPTSAFFKNENQSSVTACPAFPEISPTAGTCSIMINYRYLIGKGLNWCEIAALSGPTGNLLKRYPVGRHWPFDAVRFNQGVRPEIIFDAGANVGMTSLYIRWFFPDATIHAFEPVSATFNELNRSVSHDSRILPRNIALGDLDQTQTIEVDPYSQMSTLVSSGSANRTPEKVSVVKLDSYVAQQNLARIDVLKMDVQGFEMQLLQGAEETLKARRIKFIYAEIGFTDGDRETAFFPEIHARLASHSFSLCGFYEVWRKGAVKERLGGCNALYMLN